MKQVIYTLLSLLVIPLAQATPVMLATDVSYADILVASVAANKIGAEVYWVNNNTIPQDIYTAIEEAQPEEIYIIGGPAVVSEDVEANLSASYNVTRIWGMTRFGTAAEVAKYFWAEGASRAVIAADLPDSPEVNEEYAEIVAKAKDIAITQSIPLLLTLEDTLPAETGEALKELGVKEVYIVGEVEDNVKNALRGLNISIIGEAETPEEAEREAFEHAEKIIIAAIGGWKDMFAAPFAPKGIVLYVRNESEVPFVLEKVNEILQQNEIEEIKVVGIPWLASKICDALNEQNLSAEIECITGGKRTAIAKSLMKKWRERLEKLREEYLKEVRKLREILKNRAEKIREKCEMSYEKAKSIIDVLNQTGGVSSIAKARFGLIEALRNECVKAVDNREYAKAYRFEAELRHEVKMLIWSNRDLMREDLEDEIEAEMESEEEISEKAGEMVAKIEELRSVMRELPGECGEELRKANELIKEGEIREAVERLRIAKKVCEMAKIEKLREIAKKIREERVCIQVITHAVNPTTGECKVFSTPCDVPEGWKIVRSCRAIQRVGIVKEIGEGREECLKLMKELEILKQQQAEVEEIREVVEEIREKCRLTSAGTPWIEKGLPLPLPAQGIREEIKERAKTAAIPVGMPETHETEE